MKVSFVIPAFNEEVLLGACLDSVAAEIKRSGLECEVVVVDNGSTDDTWTVARERGARMVSEPRRGITRARQAGLEAARFEFVASVDADSLVPPGWLSRALRELEAADVVAVTGPLTLTGVPRGTRVMAGAFNSVTWLVGAAGGAVLQGGNAVVRRDALVEIGGYDQSIDFYGEDTDTAVKLARIGRVAWRWSMAMPSSGRRLARDGALRTGLCYAANYASVALLGRPVTKTHSDVRK